jgi:hypothetical protein
MCRTPLANTWRSTISIDVGKGRAAPARQRAATVRKAVWQMCGISTGFGTLPIIKAFPPHRDMAIACSD